MIQSVGNSVGARAADIQSIFNHRIAWSRLGGILQGGGNLQGSSRFS